MQTLERELATYKSKLNSLLSEEGKYVLISGDTVIGTYESYADALKIGYDKFGVTPFLVKKISATEQISYFTRNLHGKCPA